MDTVGRYEYSEKQRNLLESAVIPFAYFDIRQDKVHILLVSDGLCQLMHENREAILHYLESPLDSYIYSEDIEELEEKCHRFFFGNSAFSVSFRVKLKGHKDYRRIFANGKKVSSNEGKTVFLMWYNDMDDHEKIHTDQIDEFNDFLKGESNLQAFHTFGYQGYSVWNITKDIIVYESGLGYSSSLLGDTFSYSNYYSLNAGWLCDDDDVAYFSSLSPEHIKESFQKGQTLEEHIFTFGSNSGEISVKITPSLMQSPENGDIYLKLQAENVTDSVVYENMLHFSAKVSEFMAYVDGNADSVYFVNTQSENDRVQKKLSIAEMLPIFSVNFGCTLRNSKQLFEYMNRQCGKNSSTTIINRISGDCAKSIRIQIVDKEEMKYFISGADVTELMKMEVNFYCDDLTGLPNMTAFRVIAQPAMEKIRASGQTSVLVYFDVRDMKAINEKYGFEKGDIILSSMAYTLKEVFTGDPVSRQAEDHFVVLTNKRSIEQRLETIHEKMLNNPLGIPIQICAGIYVDNGQNLDIDAACDRARLACKTLKGDYNRKYKIFDSNMFEEYHKKRYILTHFDEALEKNYIKVYYQPIVRCLTGNICDIEALCRWEKPDRGVVQPSQFISVLEEHRLIHRLDFYMIRKICEDLDMLRSKNFPVVPVSVNLSRINFEMCDVAEEVIKIVDSYRIPHKLLTIEITESAFIHNSHFLNSQINRFREAGFDVWMDDFGSEYSSLNTLQEFTFDLIKLDMKFMDHFTSNSKNSFILSYVVEMVSKLGLHTLAEGVDSKEQLRFLRDIGCEKVQGYLFSRPMPCEYFMEKYQQNIGLGYDDVSMSSYYDRIAAIRLDNSVLTDYHIKINDSVLNVPVSIMEYRSGKFRILKMNPAYKKFLQMIGFGKYLGEDEYEEWERQPSKEFSRAAIKCLVTHSTESVVDDFENDYIVSARLICISYNFATDTGAFIIVVEKYHKKSF